MWVRACPQYTNAKNKIRRFAELYMNLSWSFQQITFENGFSANFKTVLSRRISPNWSQSKVEIGREWGGKRKREKGERKRAFLPNLLAISLSQATSYHFRRPAGYHRRVYSSVKSLLAGATLACLTEVILFAFFRLGRHFSGMHAYWCIDSYAPMSANKNFNPLLYLLCC